MPDYRFFVVREPASGNPTWHLIAEVTAERVYSRCGKSKAHPTRALESLPYGEKSCENCLRLGVMDADS